ncbi:MAG: dTDP-glucose 4,6-dehydratase [Candidatus Kapabacteria bacterium]|nr:dTDP-glucose 4,6-dehydratase [Candidatus Kapabacteria bacterium]
MKTVLVTGGAGFIGSNLVRWILHHRDWRVVNLDALTYAGNLENLRDVEQDPRYVFVHGRIEDAQLVTRLLEEYAVEGIIHCAAESHVDRSILSAAPFYETNVRGTLVLLEAARAYGIKRFLHVSTDEVYGSLGPDDPPFTEESPLKPNSPYAASKAAADCMVRAFVHTYNMPAIIARCSNNYGPYQFPEKLIPLMITNALADEPLPVYGDGHQVRDWIYVEDHCRGLVAAYEQGTDGEVYNFGGRSERRNIDVVRAILQLLGKPESLIRHVPDRPGHDRRYAIDCTKAERELGWTPTVTFEEGLAWTVEWYLHNRAWIESVRSGEYRRYYEQQYSWRLQEGAQV